MSGSVGAGALEPSQIVEDFDAFGITLDDQTTDQCLALCRQYGMDGEQLAVCWLTFADAHGYDALTLEALDHLEQANIKRKKEVASAAKTKTSGDTDWNLHDGDHDNSNDDDLLQAYGGTTPSRKRVKPVLTPENGKRNAGPVHSISAQFHTSTLSPSVANPSLKYSSRTNSGSVVSQYGDSDGTWKPNSNFNPKVKMLGMGCGEPFSHSYKYMFEKVREVSEVLDDGIMILADQMRELLLRNGGKEEEEGEEQELEEYSHVHAVSNETFSTVGRVCCDGVGHLNAASVLLEGSREISKGSTIPVDLSKLPEFSLFPGQVVGIRGVNLSGESLLAQELVPGKVLPPPDSPITITTDTGPVQIVVASGPFTTSSNLLYEPLTDLLTTVCTNPPHLLILLGPFLDAAHPLVLSNDLGETHDAVFTRCLRIIASTLESSGTRVVLVSSSRDVCSPMVYPTPPYAVEGNFTCVSDPALLDIEGVVVALTSTDVLFHLGKEEISFPLQAPDRLGRLTRHILRQQSMYPLYPPPEGMCLNQEQVENHARLPCNPHLLIIPSDLRYFAREIDGCVVVNPERLAKGLVGGTFARLELLPPSQDQGMVGSINVNLTKV